VDYCRGRGEGCVEEAISEKGHAGLSNLSNERQTWRAAAAEGGSLLFCVYFWSASSLVSSSLSLSLSLSLSFLLFISLPIRPAFLPFNPRAGRFLSALSLKELEINGVLSRAAATATFAPDDTSPPFAVIVVARTRIFVPRVSRQRLSIPPRCSARADF